MSPARQAGKRIAPRRKLVQWLTTLLLLAIPFLSLNGASVLRLDAATRTLFFFGTTIRIEEFYLFLLAVLLLVFAFLFVTLLFGRVWCGWLCPQTTLGDLADWVDEKCAQLLPVKALAALVRQACYLALAALVAGNLIWYFIPPGEFFARLASGRIGEVAGISLATVFLLIYLDLALVRRSFCKTVCPYGRIQLLTMEAGTLTLEFDPARRDACLRCEACLRACPMDIDIRKGVQVECINCGRCLDACREVMERRGGEGLIHYSFGGAAKGGWSASRRAILLGGITALLACLLAVGLATRQEATIKVQRGANGEVKRLADGSLVNFYTVYLENRSGTSGTFRVEVAPLPESRTELFGPASEISLPANANRRLDLALKITPAPAGKRTLELRLLKDGREVAHAALPVQLQ